jgi:ABC-type sugar transport system permease subunit
LTPSAGSLATRVWRARLSYLYLAPTFLLVLVFQYYPPVAGLYLSGRSIRAARCGARSCG